MKATNMDEAHFDLNDIEHEPTDAQLDALMKSLAEEFLRSPCHALLHRRWRF